MSLREIQDLKAEQRRLQQQFDRLCTPSKTRSTGANFDERPYGARIEERQPYRSRFDDENRSRFDKQPYTTRYDDDEIKQPSSLRRQPNNAVLRTDLENAKAESKQLSIEYDRRYRKNIPDDSQEHHDIYNIQEKKKKVDREIAILERKLSSMSV
jgi:signal recognition particle subunit SEC65